MQNFEYLQNLNHRMIYNVTMHAIASVQSMNKIMNKNGNTNKHVGAELCQAQVKLWLAKIEIVFHLIKNVGCLPFTK